MIALAFLLGLAFGLYLGVRTGDSMLGAMGAGLPMHQHQAAELAKPEEFQP